VKPIPELYQDFAGIQIMGSTKGETVIQKNSPVRDIEALDADRDVFAQISGEGKVECCVRLKMITRNCRIAV
jgi:hypothetical protein